VLDVAGGDKVPRKGGPGVATADLLVINKTDLAPLVGADLDVMRSDAESARRDLPTFMLSLREDPGASNVADWVVRQGIPAG
jgi:urease accessory protein